MEFKMSTLLQSYHKAIQIQIVSQNERHIVG